MPKRMGKGGANYAQNLPGYMIRIQQPDGSSILQPIVFDPIGTQAYRRHIKLLHKLAREGLVPVRNTRAGQSAATRQTSRETPENVVEQVAKPIVDKSKTSSAKKKKIIWETYHWQNPHFGPSTSGSSTPRRAKSPLPKANVENDLDLARSDVELPGERTARVPQTVGSSVLSAEDAAFATEEEQMAELYRRGILYDDQAAPTDPKPEEASALPEAHVPSAGPSYTVRYVAIKRKSGKRMAVAIARPRTPAQLEGGGVDEETREAGGATPSQAWPPLGKVRLFAVPGMLGPDEVTLEDIQGEGNASLHEEDFEDMEYVVVDNDDLVSLAGSMAGSWIELDSVADSEGSSS